MTNMPEQMEQEESIDLMELARKLWSARKRVLKWCGIGALVGIVVAFSIPKEYSVTVKLAPEISNGKKSLGGLGDLAAMAGFDVSGSGASGDAVSPLFYPDVVGSVPFATELFDVQVSDKKGKLQTTIYEYMTEHMRQPWWSAVLSAPFKFIGWTVSLFKGDEEETSGKVDPFRLTLEESNVVKALNERVMCTVDKKSAVITLTVTMQDPLIAATLTDTVMNNLQNYITEYRTNKARHDLEYTQELYDEAQAAYYAAQSKYARYMDANQNIVLRSMRTEQERLQNEMALNYNLYNQMAQQLQLAKAKVQESTPVYAVLQPATVPLRAVKPSKMTILVGFVFLFGAAISAWILYGKEFFARFKKGLKEE